MKIYKILILSVFIIVMVWLLIKPKKVASESVQNVTEPIDVTIVHEVTPDSIRNEIINVFGDNWQLAHAIMMAEGRNETPAIQSDISYICPHTGERSWDYGIWQISECWHPEVSYECAIDVSCSTREAYRISNGGTNWNEWYGYVHGGYLKHL